MKGLFYEQHFLSRLKRCCKMFSLITLSFLLATFGYSQNSQVVKGKIVDEKNQPVVGASIVIKGQSTGVSSDNNGTFQINASPNSTLVITSVGYAAKEVPVKGKSTLNVTLTQSETGLSEVVVVGYGTQRKEAVTGSVASISGERIREVPSPNISQALQGRLAGIQISQTSTKPGATMQIRIRGTRSLTADNNPLIVLDGIPFPGSIGDLNPDMRLLIGLSLFGALIEVVQAIPALHRDSDPLDWLADTIACAIVLLAIRWWRARSR